MIQFESPKNQSSIIKVIGVGGGGGNAVNYMYELGISGVDFVVCNTDSQALAQSNIPNKIQLGPTLTQGLGAGNNPEIGKEAAEESTDEISRILEDTTKMAFITAGMGGGTGTGAAPVISKICKDMNVLTVGIVTTPFAYEGPRRMKQAREGITELQQHVDTVLIISNDKVREQYGNLPFSQAFGKADDVLSTAARCITDLITVNGRVNLDFNDVQTVMKNGGVAILGSARAEGENRAKVAVEEALESPLLNDSEINGAKWILLNITSAAGDHEHTLDELETIQSYVQEKAGNACDIILGMGNDPELGEKISVTIIATGFQQKEINTDMPPMKEPKKIVVEMDQENGESVIKAKNKEKQQAVNDPTIPQLIEIDNPEDNVAPTAPIAKKPEYTYTDKTTFNLELPDNVNPNELYDDPDSKENNEIVSNENDEDNNSEIKLVIKDEEKAQSAFEQPQVKIEKKPAQASQRPPLTDFEQEEQRRFEEQKRAFEERAERLKQMSIDHQEGSAADEIEQVPAYVRQKKDIREDAHSSDDYLSDYYIQKSKDGKRKNTLIRTVNSFLSGKKPD